MSGNRLFVDDRRLKPLGTAVSPAGFDRSDRQERGCQSQPKPIPSRQANRPMGPYSDRPPLQLVLKNGTNFGWAPWNNGDRPPPMAILQMTASVSPTVRPFF